MIKMLILGLSMLLTFTINGMEVKTVVEDEAAESIALQLSDSQVNVEKHLLKLSQTLANLLEDLEAGEDAMPVHAIPVPNISSQTWKSIHYLLKGFYTIKSGPSDENDTTKQLIDLVYTLCRKLNSTAFVNIVIALNYLDIPLLIGHMLRNYHPLQIDVSTARLLPLDLQKIFMANYCEQIIGSLPKLELVIGDVTKRTFDEGTFTADCVSRDRLVAALKNNTMCVWSLIDQQKLADCTGHSDEITSIHVMDRRILSGSVDRTVRVWDLDTGHLLKVCEGHEDVVTQVSCSENIILSGSLDGNVRAWNAESGEPIAVFRGGRGDIHTSLWKVGNSIIAHARTPVTMMGPDDNEEEKEVQSVYVWDYGTRNALIRITESYKDEIRAVCVDSQKLIIGFADGTIKLWQLIPAHPIPIICKGHSRAIHSLKVVRNRLVSSSVDGEVRVWDVASGNELAKYDGAENFCGLFVNDRRIFTLFSEFPQDPEEESDSDDLEPNNPEPSRRGITIRMRDLDTGRETTVYRHECTQYRPIDIVEDRIFFGSNYPQDPVSRSTIHAGSLAFGYEIEIDRDPIDPRFYRITGFIAHGRIFAVASSGIIRVWDTVLLDHLIHESTTGYLSS